MKEKSMRSAIAMIELIFAIVIIAISIMTIPTMMNVASDASKRMIIDDDVMSRLSGQMIDKFQGRWGGEYTIGDSFESNISAIVSNADLNCSRINAGKYFRGNPDSATVCNLAQVPIEIPSTAGAGANQADGNVSKGLEMLNAGTEALSVVSSTGESLTVNATYNVRYVNAGVTTNGNSQSTVWNLGSSGTIASDNGGSRGTTSASRTNLKRVVVNFWNNDVNTTLTFFKSNKGGS